MSFKQFVPDIESEWDSYWKKTSIKQELKLTKTDGLLPIFEKHLPKNGKILEAGCGLGKWVIILTEKGYEIQGVDSNSYALEELRKYFPKAKVRLDDVNKLSYPNETFTACISLGVVEHFEKGPQKALREAYRILKKGGTAIVEVPYDSPLRKIDRFISKLKTSVKYPVKLFVESTGLRRKRNKINLHFYEYRYNRKELEAFMKEAGFTDIKIFPKDDLSKDKSIALWLDYLKLQKVKGKIFELNSIGKKVKWMLELISPFSYSALIVAVAKKQT